MDLLLSTHGALDAAPFWLHATVWLVALLAPVYLGWRLWQFSATLAAAMWLAAAPIWVWTLVGLPLVVLNLPPLRRGLVSARILKLMRDGGFLPQISETERTAISAGTVWLDGELFSGSPNLERLASADYPDLTAEERAFLDGPVNRVCEMTDDWQVWQQRDLPEKVWDFLKRERFFGMIIPKEYDGLGLSPSANSAVVTRLTSSSLPLAITVMVPNSLGPAELLIHYGTDEQKNRWLPPLARGEEIPCFALTEPGAGSDAGAIQAKGVVFRDDDGRLMLRLSWDKRYITLAAVSTVLGLAFNLHDPENLLGRGHKPGITCALIPTSTPGVVLGRRHDPLGVPFYNCPTNGKDVVVPLEEAVIGGTGGVGQGWRMLMECLSAGRGISLPACSTGGAQLTARAVGAYAGVRKQFGLPIGKFEGIEEPMARIAGFNYILEAARRYTNGGLDGGAKPAVVTAIMKYNTTEMWRKVVNDGMDILGGAAISRGPRNLMAHGYIGTPICITVEGANILTRTLMIFGQGAIRCHPYAYSEIEALTNNDLESFDRNFFQHIGHVAELVADRRTRRGLLAPTIVGIRDVCLLGRCRDGHPRWQPQAQGDAHWSLRRCVQLDVSRRGDAAPVRGGRSSQGRPAAAGMVDGIRLRAFPGGHGGPVPEHARPGPDLGVAWPAALADARQPGRAHAQRPDQPARRAHAARAG